MWARPNAATRLAAAMLSGESRSTTNSPTPGWTTVTTPSTTTMATPASAAPRNAGTVPSGPNSRREMRITGMVMTSGTTAAAYSTGANWPGVSWLAR